MNINFRSKTMPFIFIVLIGSLFFFNSSSKLQAQEQEREGNIHLGPIHIHPSLNIQHEFSDNVFKTERIEKEDFITTASPGLFLQLPMGRHLFQLGYRADLKDYADYDEFNTQDQSLDALMRFDFPGGLEIEMRDKWISSSTPPDYEDDIRNDYELNVASLMVGYHFADRWRIEMTGTNEARDYNSYRRVYYSWWTWRLPPSGSIGRWQIADPDPELDNYILNDGELSIYYRFLPKTSLLLEYGYTHVNNTDMGGLSTDSDGHRGWLGLCWDPTAKLSGTIKGGYIERMYDESVLEDVEDFGMFADLTFEPSDFTKFYFTAVREIIETSITADEGDFGTYYIRSGATLLARQYFTYKISASVQAFYFNDDYQEDGWAGKERSDNRLGGGCSIDYQIQYWLGLSLVYNYTDNKSNYSGEDYIENWGAFLIKLAF